MVLPTGTVTFLFTDIEGSSRLWERHPGAMRETVARHDGLLQAAVVDNQGHVVKMRGDGLHAVFASAQDAVAAAVAGQRALQAEAWDEGIGQLPVRMGLYSGSAEVRDGDYFGPAVNRAARLQDAGHGGQILLSQVSAGLIAGQLPEGITLRDLGRYRIKDFPAPERVYQVVAPGLPDRFPPLRAPGGRRTNLPMQTTSFVGRERELEAGKRLLADGRLATFTGPGGTGKTRLALQVAGGLLEDYRDGVWLVELAPLGDEAMVLPALAKAFVLQPGPGRPLEAALADFLRGKELLLLLDNCEHLIEECARVAEKLLAGAAGLKIVASSREPLGVPGEMILRVPSLTLPESDEATAATLRDSEAARLLSERAIAVLPDFQITDQNAAAVAEICRRLDGIPLAIELAASRLRLFSPQQIASRLNDRFRLLTGGSRTAVPRQQTLQALIDWSYELLSQEEKALFRQLSVFVGGWTFGAAEAIGEGLDVLELLDQLVNKSLVQSEREGDRSRFHYLETIRQYARGRLYAAEEGQAARDRHFAFFSGLVVDEVRNFDGPGRDEARRILKPEMDNFRLAVEWGIGRDPLAALDMLVDVVSYMLQDWGWGNQATTIGLADVRGWLETAAEALETPEMAELAADRRSRAWAQIHLLTGQVTMGTGEFARVRQETSKAVTLARELGDPHMLMAALGFFSITANAQREYDQEAVRAAEECLALARELNSSFYRSAGLSVLAGYEMEHGDPVLGDAYLTEASQGGDFISAVTTFQGAVNLAYSLDEPAEALPYVLESRRLFERFENAQFTAIATSHIAHIQRQAGDLSAAESAYRETLAHFHWQGHLPAVAHELECLAFIARAWNAPERAARLLGAAEALRESIEAPMLADEQAEYDMELAALRQELDADSLQRALIAGRVMDIDQAVDYALAGPQPSVA
ncbi:MAG: adenylate/guanylate cyclase domain-containing protein [Chloroflexota bacterium]|nr:MAG: adenylate/guanylate cyclase domain-containing protein [Chloroflexota bacterium]